MAKPPQLISIFSQLAFAEVPPERASTAMRSFIKLAVFGLVAHPISPAASITISRGTRKVPCNVTCNWPTSRRGVVAHYHIHDIDVRVTMSMESEIYYPQLQLKHASPQHWIASTRLNSDIPLPYFSWAEYNIQAPPLQFHQTHKAALFVASNCNDRSKRLQIVKKLTQKIPIVSPGRCLRNAHFRNQNKHDMMHAHMFYLAFENSIVPDYTTEKLWGAYAAGTIPVYYGAPNIKNLAPNNSFISVTDYTSVSELANHLIAVMNSKTLYDSYHLWRKNPLPHWFVKMYNFTHTHSECRLCQKAHKIMHA